MRELQRIQDDVGYARAWTPKARHGENTLFGGHAKNKDGMVEKIRIIIPDYCFSVMEIHRILIFMRTRTPSFNDILHL